MRRFNTTCVRATSRRHHSLTEVIAAVTGTLTDQYNSCHVSLVEVAGPVAVQAVVPEPGSALSRFAVLIGLTASLCRGRFLLLVAGLSLVLMSHQASQGQQVI